MWPKFGVAVSGSLTSIDEVVCEKTNLTCLYCGGGLTAKKGAVKKHHFVQTGETCKPVTQRIKKAYPDLGLKTAKARRGKPILRVYTKLRQTSWCIPKVNLAFQLAAFS